MTWPTGAYVATKDGGVFYTANLTDPTDAAQPTWTAANGGLGTLKIHNFALDPFNRAGRQLCLTTTEETVYIRYGAGNWTPILTNAQMRTLTSNAEAHNTWVTADARVPGRVWVMAYDVTGADNYLFFLRSDTDGTSWTVTQTANLWPLYGYGNLIAYGSRLWVSLSRGTGAPGRVAYSSDTGATWTISAGFDAGTGYVSFNPLEPNQVYAPEFNDLFKVTTGLTVTILQDGLNLGNFNTQNMWFSSATAGKQRIVKSYKIFATTTSWATVVNPAPAAKTHTITAVLAPDSSNEDWMFLGSRTVSLNETVYTLVGDAGVEVGKSGADPVGGVNSIPTTGNGLAFNGIGLLVADLVPPTVTITPAPGNTYIVCENQSFTATLNNATAASYVWSATGLVAGQGTATATYSWNSTPQTVTCTITDTLGGVYVNSYAVVLALGVASIVANVGNDYIVGHNQIFTAALTLATPATYTWSTTGLTAGQGTATATYNWNATPQTVTLAMTNTCGTAYNASLPVVINLGSGAITPAAANSNLVCENQTFTASLTLSTPATYVWSVDGLQSGQGTATAVYNWSSTCGHTVSVVITNTVGTVYTVTYTVTVTLTLAQIAEAIKATLSGAMTAANLVRSYGYDELPEGINDAPSLEVYWQRVVNDATTETDRTTFGGSKTAIRVKEITFFVDYIANPRNNLAENNAQLTAGASEIIDILETEAIACSLNHCPPFSLCALKTFRWNGERVAFSYGGVTYYAARFEIAIRVW